MQRRVSAVSVPPGGGSLCARALAAAYQATTPPQSWDTSVQLVWPSSFTKARTSSARMSKSYAATPAGLSESL